MIWKLLGGAGALVLLGFLVWIYGNSRENGGKLEERAAWQSQVAAKNAEIARLNQENANAATDAAEAYAARIAGMQPVIVRSISAVERFAATDAGGAACLDADRVRGIEESAAELGLRDSAAAASVDRAVRADTP